MGTHVPLLIGTRKLHQQVKVAQWLATCTQKQNVPC